MTPQADERLWPDPSKVQPMVNYNGDKLGLFELPTTHIRALEANGAFVKQVVFSEGKTENFDALRIDIVADATINLESRVCVLGQIFEATAIQATQQPHRIWDLNSHSYVVGSGGNGFKTVTYCCPAMSKRAYRGQPGWLRLEAEWDQEHIGHEIHRPEPNPVKELLKRVVLMRMRAVGVGSL